jgi:hypothetical protein
LTAAEIGLTAWTTITVAGRQLEPVYLPVSVRDVAAQVPSPVRQKLVVVPPVEQKEIRLTVLAVDDEGKTSGKPLHDAPLKRPFYHGGAAVSIDLQPWPKPGVYEVKLEGQGLDGTRVITKLWVYQP